MNPVERLDEHGLAIFLFHGVVDRCDHAVRNYTRKHLLKDDFHRMIASLARTGTPLSMEDVVQHVSHGEPFPPRSYAVTFDDAFRSVATATLPNGWRSTGVGSPALAGSATVR